MFHANHAHNVIRHHETKPVLKRVGCNVSKMRNEPCCDRSLSNIISQSMTKARTLPTKLPDDSSVRRALMLRVNVKAWIEHRKVLFFSFMLGW